MIRALSALALLFALSACGDGQPLYEVAQDENGTGGAVVGNSNDEEGEGGAIIVGELPPGSDDPSVSSSIFRFEEPADDGGGLVTDVEYDAANDVLNIDNIAFDGDNDYDRDGNVPSLAGYPVYSSEIATPDFLTGNAVRQTIPVYHAIFGNSLNQDEQGNIRTTFTIVRSGGFFDFGFGGFVYQRQGGVVLPVQATGQAIFTGNYAGLRIYNNAPDLEYISGDMSLAIDFEDFNANNGVRGRVFNRQRFDESGVYMDDLVDVNWTIRQGTDSVTEDGEVLSNVFTTELDPLTGAFLTNLEGDFTGIIAGDTLDINDGGEIVGVIEMEGDDLTRDGVTIKETGGGILYRIEP